MKKGWKTYKLGELAELRGRIGWRGLTAKEYTYSGPLFLSVHSLNYGDYVDFRDAFHISDERYMESPEIMLQKDDILICKDGAGIGKLGLVGELPEKATINSSLLLIRSGDNILAKYLYHYLNSPYFQSIVQSKLNGATTPHLYQRDITEFPVFLPSILEQQRIVAILDEAFEAIAAARANAEQNRQNARALFESYLQSAFSQRGEGWVDTTIAAATGGVFTGPFGSLLHKSDYIEHGIPLVNPAHITSVGIEPDLRKTVSEETAQRLSNYIMRTGDIVIGRRGEMGRCAIVTDVEDGWLCGTGSFVIKPSERCDARYLVRLLRSESCKTQLENIAGGAVMPNLSNTDLSNFPIILPPIDMQRSVLRKIDLMAEKIQHLESLYQRKIAALDELKQSLLQQAFNGCL